jgi:PAS domain S-box-containing protein
MLDVNKVAVQRLGYTREELMKMTPMDFDTPEFADEVPERIEELMKKGHLLFETCHVSKEGKDIPSEVNSRRIEYEGKSAMLSIARDITERKQAEEESLKAQKLESVGVLAGGIAHDFNNLLTAIMSNMFLMKKDISPKEKIYERIIATEKASARAQGLTHQLLTFAKGGLPIKELIDIRELVNESISIALRGSNVRCENLIPYDVWHIEADSGQMNQAINNILINADQSMPEGGIITINCENVMVRSENNLTLKEGNYIKGSLKDQGTGISDENLSRIFDPYFTTKQNGSGLGLSTTYSIIKKHDGHINVESKIGVGSALNIYLPASIEKVKIKDPVEDEPVTGTGKVLIMDDDELVRDSLGEMLINIGYVVEFACDGREAVDIYKNAMASDHSFNAVIMDLTIPGGMGGKEAIRELIKIDPNVKAIVSSGYSYDPIMANYSDYGFSAVLTKPYKDIQELNRILNNVIEGK